MADSDSDTLTVSSTESDEISDTESRNLEEGTTTSDSSDRESSDEAQYSRGHNSRKRRKPRDHDSEKLDESRPPKKLKLKSSQCRQFMRLLLEEFLEKTPHSSRKTAKSSKRIHQRSKINHIAKNQENTVKPTQECEISSSFLPSHPPVKPYLVSKDGKITAMPVLAEIQQVLKDVFGCHRLSSPDQETIMRILSGISTMAVLPMDCDKSVCYKLPAYLYSQRSHCITLVISPQISLMEDQIRRLPTNIKGTCLHERQTPNEREASVLKIVRGKVKILFMTPEAFMTRVYSFSDLPPIAFVCIDEVHCISEWGHNFRPSYLRISKVLSELGVQCILALSSSLTRATADSLAGHFGIAQENVIFCFGLPASLCLSVSETSGDQDRDEELLQVLKSMEKKGHDSVIVFCRFKTEIEHVAEFLGKERPRWAVDYYHGGASCRHKRVVSKSGRFSVIATTVASGIGLTREGGAVIHFHIPKSFELLMQSVGPIDTTPTYCHLFINHEGKDARMVKGRIQKDTPQKNAIKCLVKHIAEKLAQHDQHTLQPKLESLKSVIDLPQESLETLLCYMEMEGFLVVHGTICTGCKIEGRERFSPRRHDIICDSLYWKCKENEHSQIEKLEKFLHTLEHVTCTRYHTCSQEGNLFKREKFKDLIRDYFSDNDGLQPSLVQGIASPAILSLPEAKAVSGPSSAIEMYQAAGSVSQASPSDAKDSDNTLGESDLAKIVECLVELDKKHIYYLAIALGLSYIKVKQYMEDFTFLDDVIAAWLRREDYVEKKPSWKSLVEALRNKRVRQEGIATKIADDKLISSNTF